MPANRPKPTLPSCIRSEVSPLECAVPRFRLLTPLECAVTKTRVCKSFRMRSSEKRWGGGGRPGACLTKTDREGTATLDYERHEIRNADLRGTNRVPAACFFLFFHL